MNPSDRNPYADFGFDDDISLGGPNTGDFVREMERGPSDAGRPKTLSEEGANPYEQFEDEPKVEKGPLAEELDSRGFFDIAKDVVFGGPKREAMMRERFKMPEAQETAEPAAEPDKLGIMGDSWAMMTPEAAKDWEDERVKKLDAYAAAQDSTAMALRQDVARATPSDDPDPLFSQFAKDLDAARLADAERIEGGAEKSRAELQAMREGRMEPVRKTALRSGVENLVRGVGADVGAATVEYVGIAAGYLNKALVDPNADPADSALYKTGQDIRKYVEQRFPGDERRQDEFFQQLTRGAGQVAALYLPNSALSILGAGAKARLAMAASTGATMEGSALFNEATEAMRVAEEKASSKRQTAARGSGLTEWDRFANFAGGTFLGMTEAVPLATDFAGGMRGLRGIMAKGFEQGAEEGLYQEPFQTIGENVLAKATFDPERPPLAGVGSAMAVGTVLGGFSGAGGQAISEMARRHEARLITKPKPSAAKAPAAAPTPKTVSPAETTATPPATPESVADTAVETVSPGVSAAEPPAALDAIADQLATAVEGLDEETVGPEMAKLAAAQRNRRAKTPEAAAKAANSAADRAVRAARGAVEKAQAPSLDEIGRLIREATPEQRAKAAKVARKAGPLGKGMVEVAAEQAGGQAAVDRVAGAETSAKPSAFPSAAESAQKRSEFEQELSALKSKAKIGTWAEQRGYEVSDEEMTLPTAELKKRVLDQVAPEVAGFDPLKTRSEAPVEPESEAGTRPEAAAPPVAVTRKRLIDKLKAARDNAADADAYASLDERLARVAEMSDEQIARMAGQEAPQAATPARTVTPLRALEDQLHGSEITRAADEVASREIRQEIKGLKGAEKADAQKELAKISARVAAAHAEEKRLTAAIDAMEAGAGAVEANLQVLPPSKPAVGVQFRTAKGSVYAVQEDGTTVRNKAARTDVGHEGDSGLKAKSDVTVYVTKEDAEKLGEFQTIGSKKAVVLSQDGKHVGVKYVDGKNAGKIERRTVVSFSKEPSVGLTPVETWKDGTVVHFGNEIVEVVAPEAAPKAAKAKPGPLGKRLADITAEQRGGQAAVDRVAGRRAPRPTQIVTPGGEMEVSANEEIVDLADLKPATGKLQPRDRSRAESQQAIRERANALDPEQLRVSRVSDTGAPLVATDGTVISGNGRVASIRQAYEQNSEQAKAYRESLGDAAKGIKMPVRISRLDAALSDDDLVRLADLSNRSRMEAMSATERAVRDARAAGPEVMALYQGGEFTASPNRDFLRQFMESAVAANERQALSKDGELTKEGVDRLNAAVLASAYDDVSMLSTMLESTDDNIRSITNAMRDAAGPFAQLKSDIANGLVRPDMDVTPYLTEAARIVADLRRRKVKLESWFAQSDAFSKPLSEVEFFIRLFYDKSLTRAISRERLTDALIAIAEEARRHQNGGLFGDETTVLDVLAVGRRRVSAEADQPSLFGGEGDAGQVRGEGSRREERPGDAEARQGAETTAQDLRSRFYDLLEGKIRRSDWGKELGVSEAELAPLIDEALDNGWLRRQNNAVFRVAKGKRPGRPDQLGEATEAAPETAEPATQADEAATQPSAKARIEDAGEKIGGARKDRWAQRGLAVEDLVEMTGGEQSKFVTKDAVWPKPDYAALVEAGMPAETAALVKIIRDRLSAGPRVDTPQGRRDYVEVMGWLRAGFETAKSPQDIKRVRDEIVYDKIGYVRNGGFSQRPTAEQAAKLFSVVKGRREQLAADYRDARKASQMVADGFPKTAEPWTKKYEVRAFTQGDVSGFEVRRKGSYSVLERHETEEAAQTAAKALYDAERSKAKEEGGKTPERPHLDSVTRTGADVRAGRTVGSEDFLKDFGFRGVEFGNWVASDERQKVVNLAYDALHDLALTLKVPPKALSLNGSLGLAFGARGSGKAYAHYESAKLVINMTKLSGAGSLAHEWAHALDHYFGELGRPDTYQGSARGATGWRERAKDYSGKPISRYDREKGRVEEMRLPHLRTEMSVAFDNVMQSIFKRKIDKAEAVRELELRLERVQSNRDSYKRQIERYAAMPAEDQKRNKSWIEGQKGGLKATEDFIEKTQKDLIEARGPEFQPKGDVDSSYYRQSVKLSGKAGAEGYWARPTELFARAFESYVFDEIGLAGNRSEYLVQGVEGDRYESPVYKGNPYPKGLEREAINGAFDRLFEVMESKETEKGDVALYAIGAPARPTLSLSPATRAAIEAKRAVETPAERSKRLNKPFSAQPQTSSWMGFPEGIEFVANVEHIAAKRAAKDGVDHPLADPENVRAHIERVLASANFAFHYKLENGWTLVVRQPNGEDLYVGLDERPNLGRIFIRTAFIANKGKTANAVRAAVADYGPSDALKWKKDRASLPELLTLVRQAPGEMRDPSMDRLRKEIQESQGTQVEAAIGGKKTQGTKAASQEVPTEVKARAAYDADMRQGNTFKVPKRTVDAVLKAVSEDIEMYPASTRFGTLMSVEKTEPGKALATFKMLDGTTKTASFRIDYLGALRGVNLRGKNTILFARFGKFLGDDIPTLRGELRHEHTHLIAGEIPQRLWGRLLVHARSLRVMDMKVKDFLEIVGNPSWRNISPRETLEDRYRQLYEGEPDLDERLEQEAVAHFRELVYHNHFTPAQVSPVQDILDMMEGGIFGRGATTISHDDPLFDLALSNWLRSPQPTSYKTGEPTTLLAYRGSIFADVGANARATGAPFFASESEATAETYIQARRVDAARSIFESRADHINPSVVPVVITAQNPLVIDAGNRSWRQLKHPFGSTTDAIVKKVREQNAGKPAEQRHDVVIFTRIKDNSGQMNSFLSSPDTVFAVIERDRVVHEASGEQLYALSAEANDLSKLGYYSLALRASRALKQAKGTPEQMLAQLKTAGVKDSEIRATGLDRFLSDKKSITKDEITSYLAAHAVEVREVTYGRTGTSRVNERMDEWRDEKLSEADFDRTSNDAFWDSEKTLKQAGKFLADEGISIDDDADDIISAYKAAGVSVTAGDIAVWAEHNGTFFIVKAPSGRAIILSVYNSLGDVHPSKAEAIAALEHEARKWAAEIISSEEGYVRDQFEKDERYENDDKTRWSSYALDGSRRAFRRNPTYAETVLHLPSRSGLTQSQVNDNALARLANAVGQINRDDPRNALLPDSDFRSGHWSEPNVISHVRSSIQKDESGNSVFLIDELQSDWGQKIRDKGERDEEKIAELRKGIEAHQRNLDEASKAGETLILKYAPGAKDVIDRGIGVPEFVGRYMFNPSFGEQSTQSEMQLIGSRIRTAAEGIRLRQAELNTALAGAPSHPLVSTTDQWVQTSLRRILMNAVESGADAVSFTPGRVQTARYGLGGVADELRYYERTGTLYADTKNGNTVRLYDITPDKLVEAIGKETAARLMAAKPDVSGERRLSGLNDLEVGGEGMRATYDNIYPKTLAKILSKFDKSAKPETRKLKSHDGKILKDKNGKDIEFITFPLTEEAKGKIAEGLPLFAIGADLNRGRRSVEDILIEEAKQSPFWPSWGNDHPVRAMYSVREQEARKVWDAIVHPIMYPDGLKAMERWEAEAQAMKTHPDLGIAYQEAHLAWLENDKGRPLKPSELAWFNLDQLPGLPPASDEEVARAVLGAYDPRPDRLKSVQQITGPDRSNRLQLIDRSADDAEILYAIGAPLEKRVPRPLLEIMADLKDATGLTTTQQLYGLSVWIRDARNRLRQVLRLKPNSRGMAAEVTGQYDRSGGIARMRTSGDIATMTHEAAHHLEGTFGDGLAALQATHRAELEPLASPGGDGLSEGFAEWFSVYVRDPETAQLEAPGFYQAFEEFLDAENAAMLEGLQRVQADYADYLNANPVARGIANVQTSAPPTLVDAAASAAGNPPKTLDFLGRFLASGFTDRAHPIRATVKKLLALADANGVRGADGRRISLRVTENAYKIARMIPGAYKSGHMMIIKGVPDHGTFDVQGPSLQEAVAHAMGSRRKGDWNRENLDRFGLYLIARRAMAEYDRYTTKRATIRSLDTTTAQASDMRSAAAATVAKLTAQIETRQQALTETRAESAAINREFSLADRRISDLASGAVERETSRIKGQIAEANRDRQRYGKTLNQLAQIEKALQQEIDQRQQRLEMLQSSLDGLNQVIEANRAEKTRIEKRGPQRPPTREPRAYYAKIKADLDAAFPQYAEAASMVAEWQRRLLKFERDAGRWSEEEYQALLEMSDWYVPFMRKMDDLDGGPDTFRQWLGDKTLKRTRRIQKFRRAFRFKGSDRDIINPIESMMERAYHTGIAAMFNRMIGSLADLAERVGPEGRAILERVSRTETVEGTPDVFEQLRQQAIALGMDEFEATMLIQRFEQDFSDTELHLLWSPDKIGPGPVLTVPHWENGKRNAVRLNDKDLANDVFTAMQGLSHQQLDLAVKLIGLPARALSRGVTTHPAFFLRNIIRDSWAAFVNTGAWPVVTQAKGLYYEMGESAAGSALLRSLGITPPQYASQYAMAAGLMGGQLTATASALRDKVALEELRKKGWRLANWKQGLNPFSDDNWFQRIAETSETATRLGVFARELKRLKRKYPELSDFDAISEAAFIARDVMDFDRRGSKMHGAAHMVAFLNPQVQGLSRALRTVRAESDRGSALRESLRLFLRNETAELSSDDRAALGRSAAGIVVRLSLYTVALLLIHLWYEDDEEYREVNEATAARDQPIKLFGQWVRFPKAFEYGIPANMLMAVRDRYTGNDPRLFSRWYDTFHEIVVPSVIPQAHTLYTGLRYNIDSRGRPIEHMGQQALMPWLRYDDYSSQIAIAMSKAAFEVGIDMSPEKIDFALTTAGGYWGRDIKNISDRIGGKVPGGLAQEPLIGPLVSSLTVDLSKSSMSMQEYWRQTAEAGQGYETIANSYDKIVTSGATALYTPDDFLARLSPEEQAYAILKHQFKGDGRTQRLHPLLRAKAVNGHMSDISKELIHNGAVTDSSIKVAKGESPEVIAVAPAHEAELRTILGTMQRMEANNAFIAIGHAQWAPRQTSDVNAMWDVLRASSPEIADELERRIEKDRIESYEDVAAAWPARRDLLIKNAGGDTLTKGEVDAKTGIEPITAH